MKATNEPEKTPSPKSKSPSKPKVTWSGERFDIPDVQMALWKAAYPAIDVANEIDKAAAWLVANGEKKKAFGKFLNNWLARAKPSHAVGSKSSEPAFVASDAAVADFMACVEENKRRAANA